VEETLDAAYLAWVGGVDYAAETLDLVYCTVSGVGGWGRLDEGNPGLKISDKGRWGRSDRRNPRLSVSGVGGWSRLGGGNPGPAVADGGRWMYVDGNI
jgi:hypothetical protein